MIIAICDDDAVERNIIEQYIVAHNDDNSSLKFDIHLFESGEDLIAAYKNGLVFDFLFLDIQMDGIDGIKTAQEVKRINKCVIIFFITGFARYVTAAFALEAFQFILKPVNKDAFDHEFQRALKKYHMEHKKYIIESYSSTIALEIKDIIYMESTDHYVNIHTENSKHIKRGKLDVEEKALTSYGFVRTHQRYLVNMAYIIEITQTEVVLQNGSHAQISTRKRSEVMNSFNIYLAGFTI